MSMNVTILCDKLNVYRGGSNHSLDLVAEELSERGHTVTVTTFNFIHENSLPADPSYQIIEDPVAADDKVGKARSLYRKLPEYDGRADILHLFNPALLPIAGLYRKRRGKTPMVGRLNTYDIFCTNLSRMDEACFEHCSVRKKFRHDDRAFNTRLPRLPGYVFDTYALPALINAVDGLFALSPVVREIYGAIGVSEELITVVPNCYEPDFVPPKTPTQSQQQSRRSVLYVGRLSQEKGVNLLIDALGLTDEPSEYRLDIVGDGPLRTELGRRANERAPECEVEFHGWVDHVELPDYYAGADVFVHPGRWPEPFGRTILEAMQCSCPVLTSDVGGPPWILGDAGRTFPRDDAEALACALEDVTGRPRSELTRTYPDRLELFSPESVISMVEEGYHDAIGGPRPESSVPSSE